MQKGRCMEAHQDALALCYRFQEVGLWLALRGEDGLLIGPPHLVTQYPMLVAQAKAHKALLLEVLRSALAYEAPAGQPGVFLREACASCGQQVEIILAPRRLAPHLGADGEPCAGSERAQVLTAHTIMEAFIADRCVAWPGASLSWLALRGVVESWAGQQGIMLPPRDYLVQYLDAVYTRIGEDDTYPRWGGLTFTVKEWLGDDEGETSTPVSAPAAVSRKSRLVLKA